MNAIKGMLAALVLLSPVAARAQSRSFEEIVPETVAQYKDIGQKGLDSGSQQGESATRRSNIRRKSWSNPGKFLVDPKISQKAFLHIEPRPENSGECSGNISFFAATRNDPGIVPAAVKLDIGRDVEIDLSRYYYHPVVYVQMEMVVGCGEASNNCCRLEWIETPSNPYDPTKSHKWTDPKDRWKPKEGTCGYDVWLKDFRGENPQDITSFWIETPLLDLDIVLDRRN